MLLAVEGAGFFSSSASGYSKGVLLLLLGWGNEERPMRVSPCNQYRLVEKEGDPDIQLASRKNRASLGCTFFSCFGCASAGGDGPSPPKMAPVHYSRTLTGSSCAFDADKDCTNNDTVNTSSRKLSLKSSLKKSPTNCSVIVGVGEGVIAHGPLEEQSDASDCIERKKVQWTDACGGELVDIREFEQSDEDSSDEEFEPEDFRRCVCVIQ